MLTLRYYSTPREYLAAAENHLLSAELQNNLPLGICYSLLDSNRDLSSCLFASACDDQKIVATTISTVGKAILSTSADMPRTAVQVLAEAYKQKNTKPVGVIADTKTALQFAEYFGGAKNSKSLIGHRLFDLVETFHAEGALVPATPADTDLVVAWLEQFDEEAGVFPRQSRQQIENSATARIAAGNVYLWMCPQQPVSMTIIVRTTPRYAVIGYVYTPPGLRGQGYASSIVYALSRHITGHRRLQCGLFTDAANPTSNKIYQALGYRPVFTLSDVEF